MKAKLQQDKKLLKEGLNRNQLIQAFVQGAKWCEYHRTGATMWQSDVTKAFKEAHKLAKSNKLGVNIV